MNKKVIEPRHPHAILDMVRDKLNLSTDTQLAIALDVTAPLICKVRQQKQTFTDSLLLAVHEATSVPVREIKEMLYAMRLRERP